MAAKIARTVAWVAGGFLALRGAVLVFHRDAVAADRWDGIAHVAVALLLGCLVWLAADLWDAQRGRETAEEANREREYERLAADWPHEPGR